MYILVYSLNQLINYEESVYDITEKRTYHDMFANFP